MRIHNNAGMYCISRIYNSKISISQIYNSQILTHERSLEKEKVIIIIVKCVLSIVQNIRCVSHSVGALILIGCHTSNPIGFENLKYHSIKYVHPRERLITSF